MRWLDFAMRFRVWCYWLDCRFMAMERLGCTTRLWPCPLVSLNPTGVSGRWSPSLNGSKPRRKLLIDALTEGHRSDRRSHRPIEVQKKLLSSAQRDVQELPSLQTRCQVLASELELCEGRGERES